MAENFADQLKRTTLSSDQFVEETKKMIDDKLEQNIRDNIEKIKRDILQKSSLGQIEIVNNKKSICGEFCITIRNSIFQIQLPIFENSNEFKKIENANLLSYLNNAYPYIIGFSHDSDDYRLGNPTISNTSCYPCKTSFWHRLTSEDTPWTGSFQFDQNAINYIKRLQEVLQKEDIILTSISLSFSYCPCIGGNTETEVSVNDLEKIHIFNFTIPTEKSFGKNGLKELTLDSKYDGLIFKYYIHVE